jgi:hypothetical protein
VTASDQQHLLSLHEALGDVVLACRSVSPANYQHDHNARTGTELRDQVDRVNTLAGQTERVDVRIDPDLVWTSSRVQLKGAAVLGKLQLMGLVARAVEQRAAIEALLAEDDVVPRDLLPPPGLVERKLAHEGARGRRQFWVTVGLCGVVWAGLTLYLFATIAR